MEIDNLKTWILPKTTMLKHIYISAETDYTI